MKIFPLASVLTPIFENQLLDCQNEDHPPFGVGGGSN